MEIANRLNKSLHILQQPFILRWHKHPGLLKPRAISGRQRDGDLKHRRIITQPLSVSSRMDELANRLNPLVDIRREDDLRKYPFHH